MNEQIKIGDWARVTIKQGNRKQSFWARIDTRTATFTLYTPLDKTGCDKSFHTKGGAENDYTLPQHLVQNTLIVSEQQIDTEYYYKYMELKVV